MSQSTSSAIRIWSNTSYWIPFMSFPESPQEASFEYLLKSVLKIIYRLIFNMVHVIQQPSKLSKNKLQIKIQPG